MPLLRAPGEKIGICEARVCFIKESFTLLTLYILKTNRN